MQTTQDTSEKLIVSLIANLGVILMNLTDVENEENNVPESARQTIELIDTLSKTLGFKLVSPAAQINVDDATVIYTIGVAITFWANYINPTFPKTALNTTTAEGILERLKNQLNAVIA